MKMDKQIILVLREMLEAKNITLCELAKMTNILYQVIDKYYKNKVIRYNKEILLRISCVLDCEIDDILKIF